MILHEKPDVRTNSGREEHKDVNIQSTVSITEISEGELKRLSLHFKQNNLLLILGRREDKRLRELGWFSLKKRRLLLIT